MRRAATLLLALSCACTSKPKATDTHYRLQPGPAAEPHAPRLPAADAGAAPALSLLAGQLGGAGALDGPANEARIGIVPAMAEGPDHLVYFVDATAHALRALDTKARVVRTLAGALGVPGAADGVGAAARFSVPTGLALDGAGRIWVADRDNHVLRRVDPNRLRVETVAGRAGARGDRDGNDARFDYPTSIVFMAPRTMLVSDPGNHAVRAVDTTTLAVTTLRVSTPLWSPSGLTLDPKGTLYVADALLDTIFAIDPGSGAVRAFAGRDDFGYPDIQNGAGQKARFSDLRELTFDPSSNRIYAADQRNGVVRAVDAATMTASTLAPAMLLRPPVHAELVDVPFARPRGLLWLRDGRLLFSDEAEIRALTLATGASEILAGARSSRGWRIGGAGEGRLEAPEALDVDDTGRILIADCGCGHVRRFDPQTGLLDAVLAIDAKELRFWFVCPSGIATDGRGHALVADRGKATIYDIDLSTLHAVPVAGAEKECGAVDGPLEQATFCSPDRLAYDRARDVVYVTDAAAHTVRRVDLRARLVSTVAGKAFARGHADGDAAAARFDMPRGIALDPAGRLLVADSGNHVVRVVDPARGTVSTLAGGPRAAGYGDGAFTDARFDTPVDVRLSPSGRVAFVVDRATVRVLDLEARRARTAVGAPGARGVRLGALPGVLAGPSGVLPLSDDAAIVAERDESALLLATGIPR